jgi:hypothetical protein
MFGTLLRKVFGSKNDRELKRIQPLIDQINQRESALTNLSLDELRTQATLFRERLAQGTPLDSLIPEAFAVVREVSGRLLNMRHFDVQLMGGVVLHGGSSDTKTLHDTWTWDGGAWAQQQPTPNPGNRVDAGSAWDGRRVLVFGGVESALVPVLDGLWTWGGSGWSRLPEIGPAARPVSPMARDASGQGIVLFGGEDIVNGADFGDTWTRINSLNPRDDAYVHQCNRKVHRSNDCIKIRNLCFYDRKYWMSDDRTSEVAIRQSLDYKMRFA